ncbi:hypothetical protein L211DRAFT_851956 [Terfezia boudieri ATCC MYA-4762]|uniref:Uncharacterized protein n=1 Tax=Terfezia boudieri ATCC MYA-4762 TaxID=1051890 RepID=A0A3N4LGV1_9PEZI|nr:hypothetical protein L211DRAFT_851956 [Terfezia boudieri ATCC MYA-4762]
MFNHVSIRIYVERPTTYGYFHVQAELFHTRTPIDPNTRADWTARTQNSAFIFGALDSSEADRNSSKDRSLDACQEGIAYTLDPDGYYIALLQLPVGASRAPQKPEWCFATVCFVLKIWNTPPFSTPATVACSRSFGPRVRYQGKEKQDNVKYHNGNDQLPGFGHVCISVDDLDLACARFEGSGGRRS